MQSESPKSETQKEGDEYEFNLDQLPQPQLTGHGWRQMGTMLICETCPFTHTSIIPVDYQLYGINEEGIPLIRKVKLTTEN